MKRGLKIGFRTFIILLFVLAGLAGLLFYALQWSEFQTSLGQKSAKWLSDKLGSTVTVGNVTISWLDEIRLEDVNVKDLKGRYMIFVREIYINTKSNFKFRKEKILDFDNNLDYVMLKEPDVKLYREDNGQLNMDEWIRKIGSTFRGKNPKKAPPAFSIDEAIIEQGTFEFIDPGKERFPEELFDYTNFKIDNLSGRLKDFYVHSDTVRFNGSGIKGVNKRSDLRIKKIDTDFLYTRNLIELANLDAHFNNSVVGNYLSLQFDKPSDLNDLNNKVDLKAVLRNASLDAQDLGRFSTTMYQYDETYRIDGDLVGKVKDLYFDNTNLRFGKGSYIVGKGNFKGLPDVKTTIYHLDLQDSRILAPDSRQYAGDKNYKLYVEQFKQVDFKGLFKGTGDNFFTEGEIVSSGIGKIKGKMTFEIEPKSKSPMYNADLSTTDLDLAKLTGNKSLQKITFNGKLRGSGIAVETASFDLNGNIAKVWLDRYEYRNIDVDGLIRNKVFKGNVEINDPNIVAEVSGTVDFNQAQTDYRIQGQLKNANLKPMGYVDDDVRLETNFNFNFKGNKLDDWVGQAAFNNVYAYTDERNLVLDNLRFISLEANGTRQMGLRSEFFDADIKGSFLPTELIQDVVQLKNEYGLFFTGTENQRKDYYAAKKLDSLSRNYSADYELKLKNTDDFFAFVSPELSISKGSVVSGQIRIRSTSQFTMYAYADTVIYDGNTFFENELDFFSSKGWLSPKVLTSLIINSKDQKLANNVETERIEVNAAWGDGGQIDFDGGIRQKNTKNRAQLFGNVKFGRDGFAVKINPRNSLVDLLDYQWKFDRQNQITIQGKEIQFEDFRISNGEQSLALSGFISPDPTKQLFAAINHFDLRALQPLAALQIEGIADGDVSISNYYSKPILLSNVIITEFIYKNILVGDASAVIDWDNQLSKVKVDSEVDRLGVRIMDVTGTYDPSIDQGVKLKATLDDANLEIIGAFVDNIFSDLKGYANGELNITGNPRDLIPRGEVALTNGQLKINATGGYLYFNDTILFTEEGFVAKPGGFKVYDARVNGNEAYLTGGIFNGGNGNFMMGLHGYMKDPDGFLLYNTTSEDSDTFYGSAYATGDIHLTGTFTNVVITANLESKRGTKITIPLDGEASVNTNKEAIPFAVKPVEDDEQSEKDKNELSRKQLGGVKMTFNLNLNPEAECEIILDRRNNDQINARGNGRLIIDYDTRNDDFTMSGPYTVTSGTYDFSFQNLASLRKFNIRNGSRISWSGDPYRADLDMKAGYTANVNMSSIWSRTSGGNDVDNTRYPMDVLVNITGDLETPDITYELDFDLAQIPNRHHSDVYAFQQKLNDDEQFLSRNVSFVIALNSLYDESNAVQVLQDQFLVENISSMLSNQIGNLANKLDPNLEVGVLLGDFRQSLLNNLQLNFSYRFLNNRAKISGRSSYSNGLYDNVTTVSQGQLTVGGELEYLLSEDGMWRLRVHSRSVPSSNYSLSLGTAGGGNVMVSGASILFSRNFNRFPLGVARKEEEEKATVSEDVSMAD
ncbi:translocation/assembly module TamB domain-containing protein [Jiulongibacter sediminis]|uniref:translocation/assembly module TamB domain-containing protein n=1 Tax=Jiulongibacter sediminis TaxID=1605367 RepID=UPI0026EA1D3A|nr:translocation/assembly module TamB domain-containing protein [Jiulongibacter sediminis]